MSKKQKTIQKIKKKKKRIELKRKIIAYKEEKRLIN